MAKFPSICKVCRHVLTLFFWNRFYIVKFSNNN